MYSGLSMTVYSEPIEGGKTRCKKGQVEVSMIYR